MSEPSVRFHLLHPSRRHEFTWEECRALCQSLGYDELSLQRCYELAVDAKFQRAGGAFLVSQLEAVLRSKFFKSTFDFSYNGHSCEWNEQVLRRAVPALASRALTFEELHRVRVAYGLYESSDLRGMRCVPPEVPLRALKLCGRVISKRKMAHRVKHMQDTFQEPGRLQLDEFVDLALWAGRLPQEEARAAVGSVPSGKDAGSQLWPLVDFNDLLSPLDQRIQRNLNDDFEAEERKFVREKVRGACSLRYHSLHEYRSARVASARSARAAFEPLRRALRDSRPSTGCSFAGSGGFSRPTTAASTESADATSRSSIPRTAKALYELYAKRPSTSTSAKSTLQTSQRARSADSRQKQLPQQQQPEAVSDADIQHTRMLQQALTFTQQTLSQLYDRWLNEDLETFRPGFLQRLQRRRAEATAAAVVAQKAQASAEEAREALEERRQWQRQRAEVEQRVRELSCRREAKPLPRHARSCDAWRPADSGSPGDLRRRSPSRKLPSRPQQTLPASESKETTALAPALECDRIEPALGLQLPLTQPPPTRLRLPFARSCPPSRHPVAPPCDPAA